MPLRALPSSLSLRTRRGFSLVELLVGVAIGMVGLMVIFKTVATWDIHSRSTTSGGEAEATGTLAMFNLERDIRQAGIGIALAGQGGFAPLGCQVQGYDAGPPARVLTTFTLAPVVITPGATSDRIDVLASDSAFFVDVATFSASTGSSKTIATNDVSRRSGFKAGDVAVASDLAGTTCQLLQITDASAGLAPVLAHAAGGYTDFYLNGPAQARFNGGTPPAFLGGNLFNLGPNPQQDTWAINAGRLTRVDNLHSTQPLPIGEGVVGIVAQYGIDQNADNMISATEWVTPTAVAPAWTNVRAIRVAILVRSKQYERSADPESAGQAVGVTAAVPTWTGSATHPFVMTNVDGTTDSYGLNDANPNNWRYYRYRVYEKEIPLRNVIWATAPPS